MTAAMAWKEGTNLQTALRYDPERSRAEIVRMIKGVVDFIDAKKTLRSVEEIILCAEMLIEEFPAVRLEEFRIVCDRMKAGHFGNYYERLQIREFREALIKIEEERAEMMEREHRQRPEILTRGAEDPSKIVFKPQSMADLRRKAARPIFEIASEIADREKARREEIEDRESNQDLSDIEKDEAS